MFKSISLAFIFAFFAFFVSYAQELPQASPVSKLEQRIGLTDVTIRYSRPSVKDRKVWGELVPYRAVWRTGANACTVMSFSDNVSINGQTLPAGEYSFFTIPTENEWTIIFNKNTKLWGSDGYKQEEDVLRLNVKPDMNAPFTETMLFAFDNIKIDGADLQLMWANMKLSFRIATDTDAKALANIKKAVVEAENTYRTYNASATYLLDAGRDLPQALDWAKKSVAMQEKFWNLYTLSRAYAANNMIKEAIATAEKSLKLAQESKQEAYVKMNQKNIEEWKKRKTK
jgi:tetratricopeptide (TPR) repeat protein